MVNSIGIFLHHDSITGTSPIETMLDYQDIINSDVQLTK